MPGSVPTVSDSINNQCTVMNAPDSINNQCTVMNAPAVTLCAGVHPSSDSIVTECANNSSADISISTADNDLVVAEQIAVQSAPADIPCSNSD